MKRKIAILTDSSSSIYNIKHNYENVFMINLPCFLGDAVYTDFETNGNEAFYKAIKESPEVPKTSQPSIGESLEAYKKIKNLGYTDILVLPISKELSGTYQNAYLAKSMIDDINIVIVDTLTTVSVLSGMVLETAKMIKEDKSIDQVLERIEEMKGQWGYYVTVDNLTALIKNGRLSNAKGFVANLLKIKPVIKFSRDGKLTALQNVRTYNRALKEVVNKVVNEVSTETGVIHLSYTNNTADMELVKALILERLPNIKIEVYTLPATVVAHVGLAAIGVGYINY
ncbi:MAG: DegV family protein [Bacilli bacterium]